MLWLPIPWSCEDTLSTDLEVSTSSTHKDNLSMLMFMLCTCSIQQGCYYWRHQSVVWIKGDKIHFFQSGKNWQFLLSTAPPRSLALPAVRSCRRSWINTLVLISDTVITHGFLGNLLPCGPCTSLSWLLATICWFWSLQLNSNNLLQENKSQVIHVVRAMQAVMVAVWAKYVPFLLSVPSWND